MAKQKKIIMSTIGQIRDKYHGGLAGYVSRLFRERAEEYFMDAPGEFLKPAVSVENVQFTRENGNICLSLRYNVDYRAAKGIDTAKSSAPVSSIQLTPYSVENFERMSKAVDLMLERIVKSVFKGLPKAYSEEEDAAFRRRFRSVVYPAKNAELHGEPCENFLREVIAAEQVQLSEVFLAEFTPKFEERARKPSALPPGCEAAKLSHTELRQGKTSGPDCCLTIHVTVNYQEPLTWTFQASKSVREMFRYSSREASAGYALSVLTDMAKQLAKSAANAIPVNRVVPADGPGRFPTQAYELLSQKSLKLRGVRLKIHGNAVSGQLRAVAYAGRNRYTAVYGKENSSYTGFSCEFSTASGAKPLDSPMLLGARKEFPTALPDVIRFANTLAKLCERKAKKEKLDPPAIEMIYEDGKVKSLICCGKKSPLPKKLDEGETLKDFAERYIDSAICEQKQRAEAEAAQRSALNQLNPTELAILRHTHTHGRTWFHDAADAIETRVPTTKTYAGDCLVNLCETEVMTEDGRAPLLQWRWASSRKHGDFRLYTPAAKLDPKILEKAVPREYRADEIANMNPDGRSRWLLKRAADADTAEKRWDVLSILETHMPKTFLVSFAKSDSGRKFFRSMVGADAMYAKFMLQTIPGCKKLAEELFHNESEV